MLYEIMYLKVFSYVYIKGEEHPTPKFSMFSALSQNDKHLKKKVTSFTWIKLSEKLKNGVKIY